MKLYTINGVKVVARLFFQFNMIEFHDFLSMKETESMSKNRNLAKSMNVHELKYKCMNCLASLCFEILIS